MPVELELLCSRGIQKLIRLNWFATLLKQCSKRSRVKLERTAGGAETFRGSQESETPSFMSHMQTN